MDTFRASFEIDSKTDSYAARRILEQTYDTIREESRSVREGADDATALLESFNALREAAKQPAKGKLTVTFERHEEFTD